MKNTNFEVRRRKDGKARKEGREIGLRKSLGLQLPQTKIPVARSLMCNPQCVLADPPSLRKIWLKSMKWFELLPLAASKCAYSAPQDPLSEIVTSSAKPEVLTYRNVTGGQPSHDRNQRVRKLWSAAAWLSSGASGRRDGHTYSLQ